MHAMCWKASFSGGFPISCRRSSAHFSGSYNRRGFLDATPTPWLTNSLSSHRGRVATIFFFGWQRGAYGKQEIKGYSLLIKLHSRIAQLQRLSTWWLTLNMQVLLKKEKERPARRRALWGGSILLKNGWNYTWMVVVSQPKSCRDFDIQLRNLV